MLVPVKKKEDKEEPHGSEVQNTNQKHSNSRQSELPSMLSDNEFQSIFNSSSKSFETVLRDFERDQNPEAIDQMHMILLADGVQYQTNIQKMVCELIRFLDRPEFYEKLCVIFSDVSHCNPNMTNLLIESSIFTKLNYSKDRTFCVVLSMCDNNEKAWVEFKEKHWRSEFENNRYIKMLLNK